MSIQPAAGSCRPKLLILTQFARGGSPDPPPTAQDLAILREQGEYLIRCQYNPPPVLAAPNSLCYTASIGREEAVAADDGA
jgi:hypothetical protein